MATLINRRMGWIAVVAVVVVVALVALVLSRTSSQSTRRDAAVTFGSAPLAGVETLGPLATVKAGPGPKAPVSPLVVVTPGNGKIVQSITPLVKLGVSGNRTVEIFDQSLGAHIGGTPSISAPTQDNGTLAIGQNTPALIDGHVYAWQYTGSSQPSTFSVNANATNNQPVSSLGGAAIGRVTGAVALAWASPEMNTASGGFSIGLSWSASNTVEAGLAPGWGWALPTIEWRKLTAVQGAELPKSVFIEANGTGGETWKKNSSGVYVSGANDGESTTAPSATLVRQGVGDQVRWMRTSASGSVTVFDNRGWAVEEWTNGVRDLTVNRDGDGRLLGVADTFGRPFTVKYAGGSGCQGRSSSWTDAGFAQPAPGMICSIDYWNNTTTDFGWVSGLTGDAAAQLGMAKDSSNESTTWQWDGQNRPVAIRSPLAALAALKTPAAKSAASAIGYDDRGRARFYAMTPATPDGPRLVLSYQYPSLSETSIAANSPVVSEISGGRLEAGQAITPNMTVPNKIGRLSLQEISAADWKVKSEKSRAGYTNQVAYDQQGRLKTSKLPTDREMNFDYDSFGRLAEQKGPKLARSDEGLTQKTEYDTNPDGKPYTGISVTQWPNPTQFGPGGKQDWWKLDAGGFDRSWTKEGPFGAKPWSARGKAMWIPTGSIADAGKNAGPWTVKLKKEVGGGTLDIYVNNELCQPPAGSAVCQVRVPNGRVQISFDLKITDSNGVGFFQILNAEGNQPTQIASNRVLPGFNLPTAVHTNNATGGANTQTARKSFAQPWTGNPTELISPSKLVSKDEYEPVDQAKGQYGRLVKWTTPGAKVRTVDYWGADEKAEPPAPCSGPSVVQYGMLKGETRIDGVSSRMWWDSSGRQVASQMIGQGQSETTCLTWDGDSLASAAQYNYQNDLIEKTVTDPHYKGDALVSVTEVSHGPAAGPSADLRTTSQTTSDLLGQTTSYEDGSGAVTDTAFDLTGKPVATTIANGRGQTPVATIAFEYATDSGELVGQKINGREMARVDYTSDGRINGINYAKGVGNKIGVKYGYTTGSGQKNAEELKIDSATYSTSQQLQDSGAIVGQTLKVTGRGPFTMQSSYQFDADSRLTAAAYTGVPIEAAVGAQPAPPPAPAPASSAPASAPVEPKQSASPTKPSPTTSKPTPAGSSSAGEKLEVDQTQTSAPATSGTPAFGSAPKSPKTPFIPARNTTYSYGYGRADQSQCGTAYSSAGDDSLRTSGKRGAVAYATCYGANGRPSSTTDPLLTGGAGSASIAYDTFGRVESVGGGAPMSLTWTGDTQLATLTEQPGTAEQTKRSFLTASGRVVREDVRSSNGSPDQSTGYGFTSGTSQTPMMIFGGGGKSITALQLPMVGGAIARYDVPTPNTSGQLSSVAFVGVDGSPLITVDKNGLPIGGITRAKVAPRKGPYGEDLSSTVAATSPINSPQYGWVASPPRQTLPGAASVTLMGARPYLPALGAFLAYDSEIDTANNGYAYTVGDPVNNSDFSGEWTVPDWLRVTLVTVMIAAAVVAIVATKGAVAPALAPYATTLTKVALAAEVVGTAAGLVDTGATIAQRVTEKEKWTGMDTFNASLNLLAFTGIASGLKSVKQAKLGARLGRATNHATDIKFGISKSVSGVDIGKMIGQAAGTPAANFLIDLENGIYMLMDANNTVRRLEGEAKALAKTSQWKLLREDLGLKW